MSKINPVWNEMLIKNIKLNPKKSVKKTMYNTLKEFRKYKKTIKRNNKNLFNKKM